MSDDKLLEERRTPEEIALQIAKERWVTTHQAADEIAAAIRQAEDRAREEGSYLAELALSRVQVQLNLLTRENERLRAELARLLFVVPSAERLCNLWTTFTSQEMYGEALRASLTTEDFTEWDTLHTALRDGVRAFDAYATSLTEKGTP